jgi:hypothetical protein
VENGVSSTEMSEADANYDMTTSCEGSEELNGKDSTYRHAPMVSAPRMVRKMRVRGALVPMPKEMP